MKNLILLLLSLSVFSCQNSFAKTYVEEHYIRGNVHIANGDDLRLYEEDANGTNYTGFNAPDSLSGNLLYTLPSSGGSDGDLLSTDGSGVLSFTKEIPTGLILASEAYLRLEDSGGTNYMGLKAPSTVTSSTTLTLPDGDGTSGQFLKTDGSGNLGWESIATNGIQTKTLSADATSNGTVSDLTFTGLTIGDWYEITGNVLLVIDLTADNDTVTLTATHNSSSLHVFAISISETSDTDFDYIYSSASFKFQATATSLTFVTSSASASSYIAGDGTRNETYIQLEERPDLTSTSAY